MWNLSSGDPDGVKLTLARSVGQELENFLLKGPKVSILGLWARQPLLQFFTTEATTHIKANKCSYGIKKNYLQKKGSWLGLARGPQFANCWFKWSKPHLLCYAHVDL